MLDRLAKGMSVTLGLLGAGPESLAEPPSFSRMLFATATRHFILQASSTWKSLPPPTEHRQSTSILCLKAPRGSR